MSDLIKREDAIKAFEDVLDCDFYRVSEETPRERIEAIPSADLNSEFSEWAKLWFKKELEADRPRGGWIEQEDDYHHYWECSECGMGVGLDDIRNFCPNCGARMKGADDE